MKSDYKIVEGYNNALDLICRMRKCEHKDIYKCESTIRYRDIQGERHYIKAPIDNCYHEIVVLMMKNQSGYYPNYDKVMKQAYEDVRTGRFAVQSRR